jgi:hypothetical protein
VFAAFVNLFDQGFLLVRTSPPTVDPQRMTESATVPLTVVSSRTEAELLVGLLNSYGLTAVVSTDDADGQNPQFDLQGVRVLVAPSDEAEARRVLADVNNNSATS